MADAYHSRPHQNLKCIRICAKTGQMEVEMRLPGDEVEAWISFQYRHRPSWGLIVDNVIRGHGGFADAQELLNAVRLKNPTLLII